MPRRREEIRRPTHIAIKGGIVRCRYRRCYYVSGPHLTRTFAAEAAWEHYYRVHKGRTS